MFLLHCFFANVLAHAVHALSLFALDKLEAAPPSNFVVVPACLLLCRRDIRKTRSRFESANQLASSSLEDETASNRHIFCCFSLAERRRNISADERFRLDLGERNGIPLEKQAQQKVPHQV